ncbi:hypothetical protein EB118_12510 [bacterium]|nr:hypothetical protein [bacterium]NDD83731.1 hypothetical protein [bacterium]NDG30881.1 hypothetical protein [bacterium]
MFVRILLPFLLYLSRVYGCKQHCCKHHCCKHRLQLITTVVSPPIPIPTLPVPIPTIPTIPTVPTSTVPTIPVPTSTVSIILEDHNNERRLTGLKDLGWDDRLYNLAKSWSDQLSARGCPLEHNITGAARQNLYGAYFTTNVNVSDAIKMWIDEKSLVGKSGVTFEEIGHYLNIVATDIGSVGCGTSVNTTRECVVVTCNYT